MTEPTGLRRFVSKFSCCMSNAQDQTFRNFKLYPVPFVFLTIFYPTIEYKPYMYTYAEVKKITKKFNRVHGQGGFGVVYRGVLKNQQVAVKMLNRASIYSIDDFTKEVQDFVKVRHKNLVSLIGFCDDGEHLALIYEFVGNGDLNDQLSGKFGNVLSWESRLKIIIGVAQGLAYLHTELRILHRYIKPTNILLDKNFEAKLADFGLSRSSPTDPDTQASNKIYVKPGRNPYLGCQYFDSNWSSQASDIYSFGIVTLEIITNQPVVDNNRESPHISKWVDLKVAKGETLEIVDPRLNRDFDSNSVRKAMEIARTCTARESYSSIPDRPSMSEVVIELKECLALEIARTNGRTGR